MQDLPPERSAPGPTNTDRQDEPELGLPYALEPDLPVPDLPGTVVVGESVEDLLHYAASDLFNQAVACVRAFGDFHLALSAGPLQERLAMRLMIDPVFRFLPWQRTHLWLTHESAVPHDHEDSTFGRFRDIIMDHSGIPASRMHRVADPQDAAAAGRYERELQQTLAWREKGHDRLDFVVLGLEGDGVPTGVTTDAAADDGRTGGGTADGPGGGGVLNREARGSGRLVRRAAVRFDGRERDGLSMTMRMINASRCIAVMGSGRACRPAIDRLCAGGEEASSLAVSSLRPIGGELVWYLDREACGGES